MRVRARVRVRCLQLLREVHRLLHVLRQLGLHLGEIAEI